MIPNTDLARAATSGPYEATASEGVSNLGSVRPNSGRSFSVPAGFGWFGGIKLWGLGVSDLDEKERWVVSFSLLECLVVPLVALLRCCIRRAVLVLTKIAPRLALQLAHEPTIPDLSYGSPPAANSMT